MKRGRTWVVTIDSADGATRTDTTDHLARAAEGGLSYRTGEELPDYLGIWLAPNGGLYHLYSDYPPETSERFGWMKIA